MMKRYLTIFCLLVMALNLQAQSGEGRCKMEDVRCKMEDGRCLKSDV